MMRFNRRKKIHYPVFATFEKFPKEDKGKSGWKIWFWGGFFVLFLVGAIYLFLFSPVFKIREIKISGNSLISSEQIEPIVEAVLQAKIFKIIPQDTFLVLINNKIRDDVFGAFPEIASVEVKMIQINKLEILILERKTAAVLCQIKPLSTPSPESKDNLVFSASPSPSLTPGASSTATVMIRELLPQSEQCFFVDEEGIIYRQAPEISGTLLPTFYSQSTQLCQIKAQAVPPPTIQFAKRLKKELRESEVDLIGFVLPGDINPELKSFTSEGWLIYFDTSRPALTQARVLKLLLEDEIKDKRTTLEYVDLRVQNRVYYK